MSGRLVIPESSATVSLTSCGRPDLLWRTLDSFLAHHEPERLIISEDSENDALAAEIRSRYPRAEVILNKPKRGQFASLDTIYSKIRSPFVLNLEDDWFFSGPVSCEAAIALFQARQNLSMVSFRSIDELNRKYRDRGEPVSIVGSKALVLPPALHPVKFGYSFNPGLVPMEIWRRFGPFEPHKSEARFSHFMKERGYTIAYTLPGVARHIGDGRHVGDPFTVPEIANPLMKWYARARRWFDPLYRR